MFHEAKSPRLTTKHLSQGRKQSICGKASFLDDEREQKKKNHPSLARFHLCHSEKYNMCLSLQGVAASAGSPADEGLPQSGFFATGRCRK